MARASQMVQVGRRKIELTNLRKILFPRDGIVKAELIEYYLKLAPTILSHVKGRPLSLVRFPDGVDGERFFQKNKPRWAPEWLEAVRLGSEKKIEYMMAGEEASLVWLANLACIEIHQSHARRPHYDKPDYMVFDLDPPDDCPFADVRSVAQELREHVEGYGYHAFGKTTGRKGIHVLAPVEPKWSYREVFEAAEAVAKPFVASHASDTTLHIKKEARKGKILVDIYRNRESQTIVAPYSARGFDGAPVSMPFRWEELDRIEHARAFDIRSVPDRVIAEGDVWEAIAVYAVELHTRRSSKRPRTTRKPPESDKYKTPEKLEVYAHKRSFERTPEPGPVIDDTSGNAFVVHRHAASRLHYDLRLERDGTLKSWAVPKGLPPRPGIKRLAVATEDHPIEYLDFEGTIPKGEYGGGNMWKFARGSYEITKEKKKGFYFRLQSREINAEYRMHETRDNQWLLERVDSPQVDWIADPIEPMLANSQTEVPASSEYLYEVKWDGIRAMISVDEGDLRIRSRSQRDVTSQFPELVIPDQAFRASSALFDAEIVCIDAEGRPDFKRVINRLQQKSTGAIERGATKNPVVCYVFDCLYLDGRPIASEPLYRRREWMADAVRKDTPYRVSEAVDEGDSLFAAAADMGLEGIMAKVRDSLYYPGKRTSQWLKIKTRRSADCVIIGYTRGKGNRTGAFGALHLGQWRDGLQYVGKVGTGFDDKTLQQVLTALKKIKEAERPVDEKPPDDAQTVWLEPELHCEVQYASLTGNGTLREPVFLRLRPDLEPER